MCNKKTRKQRDLRGWRFHKLRLDINTASSVINTASKASLMETKQFCTDVSSASDVQSQGRIIHKLQLSEMFHSTLQIFDIRVFCTNDFGIVKYYCVFSICQNHWYKTLLYRIFVGYLLKSAPRRR